MPCRLVQLVPEARASSARQPLARCAHGREAMAKISRHGVGASIVHGAGGADAGECEHDPLERSVLVLHQHNQQLEDLDFEKTGLAPEQEEWREQQDGEAAIDGVGAERDGDDQTERRDPLERG